MFKNFFLNRTFQPAPFHLIGDGLLLWMIVGSLGFVQNQIQRSGFFTAMVSWVLYLGIFGGWFGWRRAWIQRGLQRYFRQQQQQELLARQQQSESRQTVTIAELTSQLSSTTQAPVVAVPTVDVDLESDDLPSLDNYYASYSIAIPSGIKWSDSQAIAFLRSLLSRADGSVELAIVGQRNQIFWEVTHFAVGKLSVPLSEAMVDEVVQAHYPGSQVTRLQRDFSQVKNRRYIIFGADVPFWFEEGTTASDIRTHDPLLEVARVMSNLQEGEQIRYLVSIIATSQADQGAIESVLFMSARDAYRPQTGGLYGSTWGQLASSVAGNLLDWANQEIELRGTKLLRFSEADTHRYARKLSQPLALCFVAVEMDAPNPNRLNMIENLVGAVEQLTSGEALRVSGERAYRSPNLKIEDEGDYVFKSALSYLTDMAPRTPDDLDGTLPYMLNLTVDELGALWHLPSHLFAELSSLILRPSTLPRELVDPDPATAVVLGTADGNRVGIQIRDLNLHVFVAGMQGQGKSTLLLNTACRLMWAGHGVAILDPHRKLIRDVLASVAMVKAHPRTILLEAEDSQYPIPLNPMRATPGMSKDALFSSLMWVIKSIYAQSWSEGQMERMFRNILQVVLSDPEATPLDIQKLVEDPNYRRRAIAATRAAQGRLSHALEDFWQRFDSDPPSTQRERTNPVLNRLGIFLDGPAELMMAHPFGLDFRTIINEKKVMLFDLGGDSMISEADSLGSIFFAMLFFHSYALGPIQEGEPPRYYVIIDETHRFVRAPIQQMFSEARKYGLALIMADQWLGQLEENTRQGIINNKGTTISFKVAPDQARDTARLLEPHVTAEDLIRQGRGEAAVATVYNAQTLPAFQIKTLPPLKALVGHDMEKIRQQAKDNLPSVMFSPDPTRPPKRLTVAEIDAWLTHRYATGVFARDLQADVTYQDSVPVNTDAPTEPARPDENSADDGYSDVEEVN